jgi:hypothetical protein
LYGIFASRESRPIEMPFSFKTSLTRNLNINLSFLNIVSIIECVLTKENSYKETRFIRASLLYESVNVSLIMGV